LNPNTPLKSIHRVDKLFKLSTFTPQEVPSKWYTRIIDVTNTDYDTDHQFIVKEYRLPQDRSYLRGDLIVISKFGGFSLVKWPSLNCRDSLWVRTDFIK
jgi:hypothetical protein